MTDHVRKVILVSASSIEDDIPEYAWEYSDKGRIQLGTLSLWAGRPGAGKSTAARWMAAGYSRGTVPGCWLGSPQNVAYIAAEESAKYIVKPGLRAVGADLERVKFPKVTLNGEEQRLLSITDEVSLTEQFVAEDVRVVVVDPVMSTIGGNVDVHRSNEVRAYIEPWARMAEAIGGIVIGIVHLTKSPTGDVVAGMNGSSAFGEVARSVFGFAKDPESEDGHRVMSQAKNSTGDEDLSIAYAIQPVQVTTDSGRTADVGRFVLIGDSDRTVSDVLREGARESSKPLSNRSMDILSYVLTSSKPVSPKDIADKLDIDNDTAGKYLRRLAKDGRIEKAAFGHFTKIGPEQENVSELSESENDTKTSRSQGIPHSDTGGGISHSDTSDTRTRVQPDRPNLALIRTCERCGSEAGAVTGKCVKCIVSKHSQDGLVS
jgi:DNA-binding CsgD family transcriptional regulator